MVGLSPPAVALAPRDGDLNRIARFITMQYFLPMIHCTERKNRRRSKIPKVSNKVNLN